MTAPKWVTRQQVESLHTKVIDAAGGSHGLRDEGLLESTLARPENIHHYGEADKFQLAASYAEGIARNHAFVDGNKRTAFATADLFLRKNGHAIKTHEDDAHVTTMENLGQGKISREEFSNYLRENSREIEQERGAKDQIKKQDVPQQILLRTKSRDGKGRGR